MVVMITYDSLLGGYRERIARIALFDIFHQLENKQNRDNNDRPIDMFGVGLLSLLFFFERRLMRERHTGYNELAVFLKSMLFETVALSDEDFYQLSRLVIETFRPPNGKRLKKTFYNYETKSMETIEYSLLKADTWDPEKKLQFYTLAEQGLELIFATKEYFSEFQISISQLMLRKQLEKGEFEGALRQIDEMKLNVATIKEKMVNIKRDIQRNIMSDETYQRYKEIIHDINRRLQLEYEEFEALTLYLKTTQHQYIKATQGQERHHQTLSLILKIENELSNVHFLHASLLKESIELKTLAIDAASESLYYAGIDTFNFDQEIARKMLSMPLPLEEIRPLAAPFLPLETFRTWSLLTVFSAQETEDTHHLGIRTSFLEASVTKDNDKQAYLQQLYLEYFDAMLTHAKDTSSFTLKEMLLTQLPEFDSRSFFDLWMILHQKSPLSVASIIEHDEHVFYQAFKSHYSKDAVIEVFELTDDLNLSANYTVRNMQFNLKGAIIHEG